MDGYRLKMKENSYISNTDNIYYQRGNNTDNLKISSIGFLISLILISITYSLSILLYNENFDLGPILLHIIIYTILLFLIRNDTLLCKWIVIGYLFRCIILIIIFCLSLAFSQEASLFTDDKAYYLIARNNSENLLISWQGIYGKYYIKILEIVYRIFGGHTINGRLINIFFSLLTVIVFYKFDKDINIHLKEKILKVLIFFPELSFFSVFEFKDYIFSFLLCLAVFLLFKSYKTSNIFLKLVLIIISFGLSLINCYIRAGIPIYFFIFGVIAYLIINIKKENIIINPVVLLTLIFAVGLLLFQFKDIRLNSEPRILYNTRNMVAYYFENLEERKEGSSLMKYFLINNKKQIYKLPISIIFIPFSPSFIKLPIKINSLIFCILRVFTFMTYFYFMISLFFAKLKIKNSDFYFLFLPTFIILTIFTITNAGITRHFFFMLPFIVYLFGKYINFNKSFLFIIFSMTILSIYLFAKLTLRVL